MLLLFQTPSGGRRLLLQVQLLRPVLLLGSQVAREPPVQEQSRATRGPIWNDLFGRLLELHWQIQQFFFGPQRRRRIPAQHFEAGKKSCYRDRSWPGHRFRSELLCSQRPACSGFGWICSPVILFRSMELSRVELLDCPTIHFDDRRVA